MKKSAFFDYVFSLDFFASGLFVYWANIQIFYSRPEILNYIAYALTILLFIFRRKLISRSHILMVIAVALLSMLSLSMPSGDYFRPYINPFLISGSIALICSSMIEKPSGIIFWQFIITSVIAFVSFQEYITIMGRGGSYWVSAYNLYYLFCIFLLLYVFKKRNPLFLIFGIMIVFMILFTGTRGAIIASFLAVMTSYIVYKKNISTSFKIIIGLIIILLIFNEQILDIINKMGLYIGVRSRFLYLSDNDILFKSYSRRNIYTMIFDTFLNGKFFGQGFASVPYMTNGKLGYAHNFILELLADFGVLSIVILYGFYKLLKESIWKTNNNEHLIIGLYWVCIVVFSKIFSGTILVPQTMAMIGVLLSIRNTNKTVKNTIRYNEY